MKDRFHHFLALVATKPVHTIGIVAVVSGLAVGGALYAVAARPQADTSIVKRAPIVEEVDTVATVKAADSVDLSFARSGTIAVSSVPVGSHVSAGATIAALSSADLIAVRNQAAARVAAEQAKLNALLSGTRPEELAISQTAVAGAQAANATAKQAVLDAVRSAYINADDAVHNKTDQFFLNARTDNPALSFVVPDATLVASLESQRVALEALLSDWRAAVYSPSFSAAADVFALADDAASRLSAVESFLDRAATLLAETPSGTALPAATLAGYESSVTSARLAVSSSLSAVNSAKTAAQAADTALASAQNKLALAQAGATANDLAGQRAAVAAAQAALDGANAELAKTVLRAPVSGTVTRNDARAGATAVAGIPIVSFTSDGMFEAETLVSEIDVAKISVGDPVDVRLDAYPHAAPISAKVTAIDPAATVTNGTSGYKVTVTFDQNDPRLKPGLSANLRIVTDRAEDALVVPVSALIAKGGQVVVLRATSAGHVETPVSVGIESADGFAQILSGLVAGDTVAAFGSR